MSSGKQRIKFLSHLWDPIFSNFYYKKIETDYILRFYALQDMIILHRLLGEVYIYSYMFYAMPGHAYNYLIVL